MYKEKENTGTGKSILNLDAAAFETLFKELYAPLVRYSMQFIKNQENAEDIVQELFVYLWHHKNIIDIHYSVKAYLYTSARNKCITFIKSKYASVERESEDKLQNFNSYSDPVKETETEELNSLLKTAIESLPEKCRIIFSMSRFGEMSYQEIADMLRISDRTVESQIHIAIKKIKEFLKKYNYPLILGIISQCFIKIYFMHSHL